MKALRAGLQLAEWKVLLMQTARAAKCALHGETDRREPKFGHVRKLGEYFVDKKRVPCQIGDLTWHPKKGIKIRNV